MKNKKSKKPHNRGITPLPKTDYASFTDANRSDWSGLEGTFKLMDFAIVSSDFTEDMYKFVDGTWTQAGSKGIYIHAPINDMWNGKPVARVQITGIN